MTDMADNPELRMRERGPGPLLAAARTAQNLSVADVARQLKLSASQVTALEAGEYERLPGPVFVRGFVRNYARLLKMDPDRLLAMVSDLPGQDVPHAMPTARGVPFPSKTERRWPRALMVVMLLAVVALGAYEFYGDGRGVEVQTKTVAPAAVQETAPPPAPAAASEPAAPPVQAASTSPEKVAPAPVDGTSVPVRPEEGTLRFVFRRDSWVEVRDGNGRVLMTRLNAAGTQQHLSGKPPFSLVIGNARGVELTYNGAPVDLGAHTVRDDIARLRLQ